MFYMYFANCYLSNNAFPVLFCVNKDSIIIITYYYSRDKHYVM